MNRLFRLHCVFCLLLLWCIIDHLYVAYACPWAHRTLIVRALKGLQDVISVTVVHPTWQRTSTDPEDKHVGWIFGDPTGKPLVNNMGAGGPFPACYPGNEPDPILGAKSIREVYERANDVNGKYSVPVLWDKKLSTIVSNESSDIIEMLNSQFNQFAKNPGLDLSPQEMIQDRKAVDDWIYPNINDGVYRCGFATTQAAYDIAIDELTIAFDKVEEILQRQRYIAGDGSVLTLSDIRLFVTLLRFDAVYIVYFKTNTRSVTHSPALLNYCRDIYQMPGVAETVNLEQIKVHYFTSHPRLNALSIIPRGTDFEALLKQPHDRMNL
jgi:putative glutathione S-transferase